MNFTPQERTLLGQLADLLIPAGNGFPSATQAGASAQGLDLVLASRPDLALPLHDLLQSAAGQPPQAFLTRLRTTDPAAFGILAELVPGAYFLNPEVREKLGYHGQTPLPLPAESDIDPTLLQPVLNRGPIYRPT